MGIQINNKQVLDMNYLGKKAYSAMLNGDYVFASTLKKVSGIQNNIKDAAALPINKLYLEGNSYQKVTQQGKNICPTDVSDWELGHYGTTGIKENFNNGARARIIDLIPVIPNTKYYVNTNYSDHSFVIRGYDENKNFKKSYGGITSGGTINTDNVYYLSAAIYNRNNENSGAGQTIIDNIENGTIKPFICLNSETDKSFEEYIPNSPSPDYPSDIEDIESVDVEVVGKNLANINDNTNNVSSEWNFEVGNIEKNKTYSLYLNVNGYISMNLRYNNSSGSVIKTAYNLTGINVINFTATTDGVLFINCFNADTGTYNSIPQIMLVEGTYTKDNIGEYEPYKSTTSSLDLQNNFIAKIGDVKDEIDVVTGKLTKRIGKRILKGTEGWTVQKSGTDNYFYQLYIGSKTFIENKSISSHYITNFISTTNTNEGIYNTTEAFRIRYGAEKTLEEFKTWLSQNNVEVYYVLAEPYEVQLDTTKIPLFEGINNIKINTNLEPSLTELDYYIR